LRCKISPKTHAIVSSRQELVGRAFLQNFHHNHVQRPLNGIVMHSCA
jgi:hypothetical protein